VCETLRFRWRVCSRSGGMCARRRWRVQSASVPSQILNASQSDLASHSFSVRDQTARSPPGNKTKRHPRGPVICQASNDVSAEHVRCMPPAPHMDVRALDLAAQGLGVGQQVHVLAAQPERLAYSHAGAPHGRTRCTRASTTTAGRGRTCRASCGSRRCAWRCRSGGPRAARSAPGPRTARRPEGSARCARPRLGCGTARSSRTGWRARSAPWPCTPCAARRRPGAGRHAAAPRGSRGRRIRPRSGKLLRIETGL
jgi:hypothetical protein